MLTRRDLALAVAPLLLGGSLVAGCTRTTITKAPDSPVAEAMDAGALMKNKTAWVGDNSKVLALVSATGIDALCGFRLALQTAKAPLGLTIQVQGPRTEEATVLEQGLRKRAVLLLATIGNAEKVTWEHTARPMVSGSLTRSEADALVGSPVSGFATSPDRLTDLARRLDAA